MIMNLLPRERESACTDKKFTWSPLMLLASLGVLAGCSSTADNSGSASEMGRKVKVTPTNGGGSSTSSGSTTTSTTSISTSTVTYDTSVGNGVDSGGFAELPLHSGASRYFVNSSSGSDGNSCAAATNPATPKATITAAATCVKQGAGDQVLVAQGTTYTSFPYGSLTGLDGYSPTYPTVFESYDPADPTNEAKIGHATATNRPVIVTPGKWNILMGGGTSPQYLAIRSFDFNPGNTSENELNCFSNTYGQPNYFLFENNIVRYTAFDANLSTTIAWAVGWVIRGNSFYGSWSSEDGYHTQGIYLSGMNYTLEDNVIYHAGWKIGASRSDYLVNGGLVNSTGGNEGEFRHPIYAQDRTVGVSRRNLTIDNAADGGSYRGGITATENLGIDNPIGMGLGGGTNYNLYWPNGTAIAASYNVILGSAQILGSAGGAAGWGMDSTNGTSATEIHHNIIAYSDGYTGAQAILTKDDLGLPSYAYWHDNVIYHWANTTYTTGGSLVYATYDHNVWDAAATGTNINNGSVSFPNPYTSDSLYTALGFTGADAAARKQAFINYIIANPDDHSKVSSALNLLWPGYGISHTIQ